jgi:hypothetical protein
MVLKQSVSINGAVLDVKYIKMIAALPSAQIEVSPKNMEPLLFQFDGGVGALMPMRLACDGKAHLGDITALAKAGDGQTEARR